MEVSVQILTMSRVTELWHRYYKELEASVVSWEHLPQRKSSNAEGVAIEKGLEE